MGKLGEFLSGVKILERAESPINGKITIEKSLAWGTYITVGGLTQSGGIINDIWKKPLRNLKNLRNKEIKNVLILGLGGGTVAKMVNKTWPEAKITGVDIDPKMVELGKKYLSLNSDVRVIISDAYGFLKTYNLKPITYDLILIDLYVGDEFPKKFESDAFLKLVYLLLTVNGVAIFNRLYYGEKRPQAMKFENKLEKVFKKVEVVFPEANVMFVCSR